MKKGDFELGSLAKFLFYLACLVALFALIYFFKDLLLEKFEIVKNMVRFG